MAGSRRDKYSFHNFLTSVVKGLEHKYTIIDLRNESSVSGLITHVDGFMNVEMKNVTFYDPRGNVNLFQHFYVHARNIRYVHIPDEISITDEIKNVHSSLNFRPKVQKRDNFKARKYQTQLLHKISESQPGPST